MYSFSIQMTQHALTVIGLFFALAIGQPAKAAPCEVNQVAENAHLFGFAKQMVVTPNNQWLLVLDEAAGNIKVIEIARQQVLTTLDLLGLEPGGLTLSSDGTTLYISGAFNGNVIVMDISALEPSQWTIRATWQIAGDFGTMRVDSDNSTQLFVTDRKINGVRVLSISDGNELARLTTAYCRLPTDLVQQGSLLFVACETSNKVAVFDLESNEHRKSINVGKAPVALQLHPTQPNLYVANQQSGSISVINTNRLELSKLNLSNAKVLTHPTDLLWLNGTLWILDQSAAALVALDIKQEQLKPGICTLSSQPAFLTVVTLPGQQTIYASHSQGVEFLSINMPLTRRQPQVLMAGFDPILLDITDTQFSVLAVVEEGLAQLNTVSIEQNLGGLKRVMNLVGSIPVVVEEGRQIDGLVYEAVFEIERGAFPPGTVATQVMGLPTLSLFGDLPQQFYIRQRCCGTNSCLSTLPIWKLAVN
jgi:6-phosphogluconolactonase (cycloisomerase 2 family)